MPKISVIVPVYRVEEYLPECVDSILAQTYRDFELILVDDGSPDNCGAICDAYAAKDSRIRVIHQENQGLSGARNTGIDVANGEYIAFVDSDDVVHPCFLECLYMSVVENGVDASVCGVRTFAETAKFEDIFPMAYEIFTGWEAARKVCVNMNWMPIVCNKLYRRSLFADVYSPPCRFHEDEAVSHILMYTAKRVAVMPHALYYYRKNPNSIMNSMDLKKYHDKAMAYAERYSFFCERNEIELSEIAKKSMVIASAKYTIAAKVEHKCADPAFEMSVLHALQIIKRECSESNYEWWLNQIHPALLRGYCYLKKIRSVIK